MPVVFDFRSKVAAGSVQDLNTQELASFELVHAEVFAVRSTVAAENVQDFNTQELASFIVRDALSRRVYSCCLWQSVVALRAVAVCCSHPGIRSSTA